VAHLCTTEKPLVLEHTGKGITASARQTGSFHFIENFLAMSMDTYRRIYEEVVDYRVSPGLRQVHNPTLIVAGSRESKIIVEAVSAISHLMPNATGRLASGGLGHGWNVEDPVLFNAMVRAWITRTALPNRPCCFFCRFDGSISMRGLADKNTKKNQHNGPSLHQL
jgi:hypothetical protein